MAPMQPVLYYGTLLRSLKVMKSESALYNMVTKTCNVYLLASVSITLLKAVILMYHSASVSTDRNFSLLTIYMLTTIIMGITCFEFCPETSCVILDFLWFTTVLSSGFVF